MEGDKTSGHLFSLSISFAAGLVAVLPPHSPQRLHVFSISMWIFSGYSDFLPQSACMLRLIGGSKPPIGASVGVNVVFGSAPMQHRFVCKEINASISISPPVSDHHVCFVLPLFPPLYLVSFIVPVAPVSSILLKCNLIQRLCYRLDTQRLLCY